MVQEQFRRNDIDGLRGVAVTAVLLYHFGFERISGGFIGVDVFFVISGYVITRAIFSGFADSSFTLAGFYAKRAKRLLPSLVLVIISSLIAGYFLLAPAEYAALGWQSVFSLFGVGNFYFFSNTGYFDIKSDALPLLHTWSLGVEEQFYLVWPVILIFSPIWLRRFRKTLIWLAAFGLAVAIGLSQVAVETLPNFAFYLLPARAWELLLGCAIAFIPREPRPVIANVGAGVGTILLILSFTAINADMDFPGLTALVPCLGAALLIWSGPESFTSKVLSVRPVVFIGTISYALYLWHWPVLVMFRAFTSGENPTRPEAIILILVSVVLAIATTFWLERPIRRLSVSPKMVSKTAVCAASIAACAALAIVWSDGLKHRYQGPPSLEEMWAWDCDKTQRHGLKLCEFGPSDETPAAFLWGESHAAHLAPILNAGNPDVRVQMYAECSPVVSRVINSEPWNPELYRGCDAARDVVVQYLRQNPSIKTVVLASYWKTHVPTLYRVTGNLPNDTPEHMMTENLDALVKDIALPGREIVFIGDTPRFNHDPVKCVQNTGLFRRQCQSVNAVQSSAHIESDRTINDVLASLANANADVAFVDAGGGLCGQFTCVSEVDGELIYMDPDHLRRDLPKESYNELARLMGLNKVLSR